jgi:tRNA/rRNA methyltransferase
VGIACRKRGIAQERLDQLVSGIQRQIETLGESEVTSHTIGEMVMDGLRNWTAWPISVSPRSTATFPRPVISRNLPAMSATSGVGREKPVIVLVRPQLGENIGKAARAMLNFGWWTCALSPRATAGPTPVPVQPPRAPTSCWNAQVFETLADAVADCAHVYATTVRKRGVTKPVLTPEAASEIHANAGQRPLIFGPERSGLETDDVALARAIVTVPINPEFGSLNLAQAVILCAYEWSKGVALAQPTLEESCPLPRRSWKGMIAHLDSLLEPRGYFSPRPGRCHAAHFAHHADQTGVEPSGSAHHARRSLRADAPARRAAAAARQAAPKKDEESGNTGD